MKYSIPAPSRLPSSILAIAVATCANPVYAHSFGRAYSIPVPIWMYLYGATAALALSFLLIAWFATSAHDHGTGGELDLSHSPATRIARRLRRPLQGLSLAALLLAIATALFGTRNPYANFAMTWFWIVFVLGLGYASILWGDLYRWLNPWRVLVAGLARIWRRYPQGLVRYPTHCGYWPALVLYMGFIWLELEVDLGVRGLGQMLLSYSLLNLLGVGLIGARDWFRYGEFFGVLLRMLASMAPLALDGGGRVRLRAPFAGLVEWRAENMSLLLFIMFMLSSTAYDGLRGTAPWAKLFWVDLYNLLQPWVGSDPIAAYHKLKPLHTLWSATALILSPLLYLAIYLSFIALMRVLTRTTLSVRELALHFGPSLLPIALVYHAAHYYSLFLTQGVKIFGLLSDPFGWGWNLFGSVHWLRSTWSIEPESIWHTQLTLIVAGHIFSVYIAHLAALQIFGTRRAATISQLPMLVLMMFFTAGGLWILAQPIVGS